MMDAGDKRVQTLNEILPSTWDNRPIIIAHELRTMLKSIVDAGTSIDSGCGDGIADLHPVIGGVEYHIQIRRSSHQPGGLNGPSRSPVD